MNSSGPNVTLNIKLGQEDQIPRLERHQGVRNAELNCADAGSEKLIRLLSLPSCVSCSAFAFKGQH